MQNTTHLTKSGNPNHDPATGQFASFAVDGRYSVWMPSSRGIDGLEKAKKYFKANLSGVWELTIHRKAGDRKVKVNFNENQDHAYTKEVDGQRVFWPERAQRMCMILETIAHPGIVLENGNRDLFVERVANNGDHDVVVLEWKPDAREYRFRSSHYWGHEEFNLKTKQPGEGGYKRASMRGKPYQKIETPKRLSKSSGASSTFSNLHLTTLEGSCELGAAPEGSCWQPLASVSYVADLVKSETPGWDVLFKANPTPAQIAAGNYAKRKVAWHGMTISIENEAGSVRRGIDPTGKPWETTMVYPYGYLRQTTGVDGDAVDVYLGPDADAPMVYVIHQRKAGDWRRFDEDKAMLGFKSEYDAVQAFLQHYNDLRFLGPVTAMPVAEFVEKARATFDKPAMIKTLEFGGIESGDFGQYALAKSITLILPSGNSYEVAAGDYSFDTELLKAQQLAPGARWITVHPGGNKDGKGVPVMVQESSHGSGVFHVIGGAGGKLNYLKLSGIKPESTYKQEASERAKAKTEAKKQQATRDKELGLDKGKKGAREAVAAQKRQAQKSFIETVAKKMGWKPEDLQAKIPENTTLLAQKKLENKHHAALLEKANQAVDLQVQHLLADTQARQEAGVVAIPNEHTPDDQLTTADLEDARPQEKKSLGFAAHYAERAEEKGSTAADIKQEADQKKAERQSNMTDNQRSAIKVRGTIAKQVNAEIDNIREPITADVKAVLASAKDAVELIKARKAMQAVNKAAQAANKDIDAATEVKAYNLEVTDVSEEEIASDIENDLRTTRTKAFLSTIKSEVDNPEVQLKQHLGAGAFNSINGLALAATNSALVDRSVVDVLGIAGAAQVLARRLHADLTPDEVEKLTAGMEDFHLHHYMETSKDAMAQAQELHDAAKEIGLGEASHGDDFEAARELNKKRKDCIEEAHKVLGTALGEMEANAALVTAMKAGRSDKPLEVPMGKLTDEDAITQVRAIGLDRGDYRIDKVAGNQVLTITPAGLDKLSKPVDRADMERTKNTLSILSGEQDEDNWLPQGFANRPDLAMNLKPGVAASLAQPFKPVGDLQQSLKDYIGGRAADGDSPADIMADIQSSDFFEKSGDTGAYREALDTVASLMGKDGKMARAESLTDTFNQYADDFVQRTYGGAVSTLQRQNFEPDKVAQEALHRALSDEPAGIVAYKPIGELTNNDQRALREHFYANVAHEDPQAAKLRERLDSMAANEPEKEATDMFGETAENPEWGDWKAQRDTLAQEVSSASLDWQKYASAMGGHEKAYASMQDLIRSKVGQSFHQAYNTLNPSAPLKLGRQVIRGNLNHLDAVDPQARAQRETRERELIDSLRERNQGKYASGSVSDKMDRSREEREAFEQSQMGFFSTEQEPDDMFGDGGDMFGDDAPKAKPAKPLAADERHTLGHAAERTIAGMVPLIGQNAKPGQPVKLFNPTMSGPDGIMRQRSIKFIAANKRVALSAGTGAGKSAMMLGAFSHLQSQGKVKKGVIVVPSIVQGQMGAEANRFLEPGRFKWHCEPGASFESRLASYKDPGTHFSVVTHQSFRDDLLKMASMKTGEEPSAIADRMEAMPRKERAAFTKDVLAHHGINFDFSSIDEGHGLLDRQGKENSRMSNMIGGVTDNTPYTISASADLVKNDVSEAASIMEKLEPEKHGDRAAFMRRYGVDTFGAKAALKREMLNNVISYKLDPKGVTANKQEISVKPSGSQQQALSDLDKNIGRVRIARMEGKTDVEAMKAISPDQFKGIDPDKHEALAKELSASLGIIKGSAVRAILDAHPESAKLDAVAKIAATRKGKPGVIFAHSLEAVANIKSRLEKDGHRVLTLTGSDSSADKAAKLRGFNPDVGERTHDIMVASDAGATGANMQSGSWLTQFDTPMTAMGHAQRQGRINRVGQKSPNIELMDLVADHPSERVARQRLKDKYALRDLMSSPYEAGDDTGIAHFLHQRKVAQQNAMF